MMTHNLNTPAPTSVSTPEARPQHRTYAVIAAFAHGNAYTVGRDEAEALARATAADRLLGEGTGPHACHRVAVDAGSPATAAVLLINLLDNDSAASRDELAASVHLALGLPPKGVALANMLTADWTPPGWTPADPPEAPPITARAAAVVDVYACVFGLHPDGTFDGCYAVGRTPDEARERALDELVEHGDEDADDDDRLHLATFAIGRSGMVTIPVVVGSTSSRNAAHAFVIHGSAGESYGPAWRQLDEAIGWSSTATPGVSS
jgi:hypothetical protein